MKKVLLADDDLFITDLLETKLSQAGYVMKRVVDGDYVIPELKNDKFDLLILDLDLPHKTGFVILEELRKDEVLAPLPVIILSNQDAPEVSEKARLLGATSYVKAMTDLDEFVHTINRLWS